VGDNRRVGLVGEDNVSRRVGLHLDEFAVNQANVFLRRFKWKICLLD
jgi:hypothetical protein